MKVIIFGATGSIGQLLVDQAIHEGHVVTAFVRNPLKLKNNQANLKIFEGDVFDKKAVEEAIRGQEVVFCVLGGGRKGEVRSGGTLNIIKGMQKNNVVRLVCQSTLGAGESKGNLNFFWKHIMFGWFLKEAFLDHELQEKYVKESNLEWTLVRPSAFTNGERTGNYKEAFKATDKHLTLNISRLDVVEFLLKEANRNTYIHQAVGISN